VSEILNLIAGPAVEPVNYDEAKLFLRLEVDDDQALVTGLIIAARQLCENRVHRSFITTSWELIIDGFPYGGGYYNRRERYNYGSQNWLPSTSANPIKLPRPPLVDVTAISYLTASGSWSVLDPSTYRVVAGTPGRILPTYGTIWPFPLPQDGSVKVEFNAGYGPDASSVPEVAKLAIKMAVTHFYENRGDTPAELPPASCYLLDAIDPGSY
jgi:uncharacterized phiE125 gp8 family phage protein